MPSRSIEKQQQLFLDLGLPFSSAVPQGDKAPSVE